MFRDDLMTLKREIYHLQEGLALYDNEILIAKNVPCHLSTTLNNTVKRDNVPYLNADFTLFLNSDNDIEIKQNDILYITTSKNQTYRLYAGEVKKYNLSVQVKCRQEKIAET